MNVKKIFGFYLLWITLFISILIALIVIKNAQEVFLTQSEVLIKREFLENPETNNPGPRNRWVWIREGLSNQVELVTHDNIKTIIQKNSQLFDKYNLNAMEVIKWVTVEFTGADEGRYIFRAKSPYIQINELLIESLIAKLKDISISDKILASQKAIDELKQQMSTKNQEEQSYFRRIISKLEISLELDKVQLNKNFTVLYENSSEKVWPRPTLIILAALLIGTLLGLFFEYLKSII